MLCLYRAMVLVLEARPAGAAEIVTAVEVVGVGTGMWGRLWRWLRLRWYAMVHQCFHSTYI